MAVPPAAITTTAAAASSGATDGPGRGRPPDRQRHRPDPGRLARHPPDPRGTGRRAQAGLRRRPRHRARPNKLIVSTPALRDRLWAGQIATQQLILQALSTGQDDPRPSFETRVTVAACLAAATTAILAWVETDGTAELPDLVERAFDTLTHPR